VSFFKNLISIFAIAATFKTNLQESISANFHLLFLKTEKS